MDAEPGRRIAEGEAIGVERHADVSQVVIAGIRRGGVPVAAALAVAVDELRPDQHIGLAAIDVVGYRDDAPRAMARLHGTWAPLGRRQDIADTQTAPAIEDAVIVLVDDVMQTGRTLRAALDAVAAHGRPAAMESLVLIDRGHRELPLRPTYVGKNVPVGEGEWVEVRLWDVAPEAVGAYLVRRA